MRHEKLLLVVEARGRNEKLLAESYLAVWTAISEAEPELAAEILKLFSTIAAAALWVASSLPDGMGSPARMAAQGQGADILARVRKTIHGFAA